jgi:hypothetical protein
MTTDGTHLGICVADLEASMASFTRMLGYAWADVLEWDTHYLLADGTERVEPVRFTMSSGPAPHLELMEAATGIFSTTRVGTEFHHFARWVDDLPGAEAALLDEGYAREAWGVDTEGRIRYAYYVSPDSDLRLELCDTRELPNLQRWIDGGAY